MTIKNNISKCCVRFYGAIHILLLFGIILWFMLASKPIIGPIIMDNFDLILWLALLASTLMLPLILLGLVFGKHADNKSMNTLTIICGLNIISTVFLGRPIIMALSIIFGPQPFLMYFCIDHLDIALADFFEKIFPMLIWVIFLLWSIVLQYKNTLHST